MALQHLASLGIASIVFILRGSKSGPDPIWKHDHNGMGMRKDRNTKRKTSARETRLCAHQGESDVLKTERARPACGLDQLHLLLVRKEVGGFAVD